MRRSIAPAGGAIYAVLFVVGEFLLVQEQIDGATDQEILSYYADGGNRTAELAGFILATVGVLFFLWFVATLRSRLREVESEPKTLSALVFGAGMTAAALLVSAVALFAGTSFATEIADGFTVDPNLARFVVLTGFLVLIGSVLVNCALIAAASVLALRTAAFPNWLGWAGFGAIVLALVEAFLLPLFVIPVWFLVFSVVLSRRTLANEPRVPEPVAT